MKRVTQRGFALPTVLIAGIVMMVVLMTALVAANGSRTMIERQYHDRLVRLAIESGVKRMDECYKDAGDMINWSDANPLRPYTDCNGQPLSGLNCTNPASNDRCTLVNDGTIFTTFKIGSPTVIDGVPSRATVEGSVSFVRRATNQIYSSRQQVAIRGFEINYQEVWNADNIEVRTKNASVFYGVDANDGAVWRWGNTASKVIDADVVQLYYGGFNARTMYALGRNGHLYAWGSNAKGAIGNGTIGGDVAVENRYDVSGTLPAERKVVRVYTGQRALGDDFTTFAVLDNGTFYGWGYNEQRSLATTHQNNVPSPILLKSGFAPAPTQLDHAAGGPTYYLASDQRVYGGGGVSTAQLYHSPANVNDFTITPSVGGSVTIRQLFMGGDASKGVYGISTSNNLIVWCNGTCSNSGSGGSAPAGSRIVTNVRTVDTTPGLNTYAINNSNQLLGWGANGGNLGFADTGPRSTPVQIPTMTNVRSVTVGCSSANCAEFTTVAVKNDGTVWAWGYNNDGQAGNPNMQRQLSPYQITALGNNNQRVIARSLSDDNNRAAFYAIKSDGSMWGWGYNSAYGSLGDGSIGTSRATPVRVLTGYVHTVNFNSQGSFVVKTDGTAWAWGHADAVPDGGAANRPAPVQVSPFPLYHRPPSIY